MRSPSPLSGGSNLPSKGWQFNGFNLGVNNFALATELKGNELAQALNCELFGKRSIRPRRGGQKLGDNVGASQINGLFQYKEGAVNEILAISGGTLKKYNPGTLAWDVVTGGAFTSGLRTRGVKTRQKLYFGNGTDNFMRYDGTDVEKFAAVGSPTGLSVTPAGTAGTTTYIYQITVVTDKG